MGDNAEISAGGAVFMICAEWPHGWPHEKARQPFGPGALYVFESIG